MYKERIIKRMWEKDLGRTKGKIREIIKG